MGPSSAIDKPDPSVRVVFVVMGPSKKFVLGATSPELEIGGGTNEEWGPPTLVA
jgi:hypothetical protein